MSGFAAVFHLDGAPVDRAWLERMADFLGFRGPDGREVWVSGSAGMCHTLLRISAETDGRPQIAQLDDRLWIAGDVRVDDRENLRAKFPPGFADLKNASSAELILRAYEKWGEACVEHLRGDFSFVIWDARRRQVFAARDQMGVRPLFYAQVGQCLLISNTLDCLRQISIVSDEVNERAVGDLLLVGRNQWPTETFFSAIQRLRVAHRLIAGPESIRTERYWTLPIDEPVYYKRSQDYINCFNELLRAAVRDRLPDGPVGVFMSGGLDSPALAATAVHLGASVSAFTSVWDRLIPDQERHYSGLVAERLGLPIFYNALDEIPWGWDSGSAAIHTPEPIENPLGLPAHQRHICELFGHMRIFFRGEGPDAALSCEWQNYVRYLARNGRWGRLCGDLALYIRAFRRVPFWPSLKQRRRRRRIRQESYEPSFPGWINPDFERRAELIRRWQELYKEEPSPHPIRRFAYSNFSCDFPMGLNTDNGGCPVGPPIEPLHPFWDLRLLRFFLSLPVLPWCRDKFLIRAAFKGVLPEAVRRRAKSPLFGIPYRVRLLQVPEPELPQPPTFATYVNRASLPAWPGQSREDTDQLLRAISLQYWLLAK